MTEPRNLRDAAEVTVTEADQSAAEAWLNANNGEWIDALNLAEAFARNRAAVEAAPTDALVEKAREWAIVVREADKQWSQPLSTLLEQLAAALAAMQEAKP